MRFKRKGLGIQDLPSIGLAFIIIAIIFGVGGVVLSETEQQASDETTVNNETGVNGLTSVPTTFTTANDEVKDDSETVWLVNSSDGSVFGEMTKGTNYSVVNYETGEFNVTDTGGTTGSDVDVNITYTYFADNNATNTIGQGQTAITDLAGWLPIIGIVVAAAVIIGIVINALGVGRLQ